MDLGEIHVIPTTFGVFKKKGKGPKALKTQKWQNWFLKMFLYSVFHILAIFSTALLGSLRRPSLDSGDETAGMRQPG
jgi:hypothetical protein